MARPVSWMRHLAASPCGDSSAYILPLVRVAATVQPAAVTAPCSAERRFAEVDASMAVWYTSFDGSGVYAIPIHAVGVGAFHRRTTSIFLPAVAEPIWVQLMRSR